MLTVIPLFVDMATANEGIRPTQIQRQVISKEQPEEQNQRRQHKLLVNKVKRKLVLKLKAQRFCIRVIVPKKNNLAWVAGTFDQHITLINIDGATHNESVKLCDGDNQINDAKEYENDLLVTFSKGHQIIRLSADGNELTTFCDMSPYSAFGLCVTQNMDAIVFKVYDNHKQTGC